MPPEHSVFISYRRADGSDLASWIFEKFSGRGICSKSEMVVLTAQIDQAIPGGSNWKKYLSDELKRASSLLIVCSPEAMRKFQDRNDYFYHEIEWWVENRKHYPPILVATKKDGNRYVPTMVMYTWKNLHVSEIDKFYLKNSRDEKSKRFTDIFIESISRGICNSLEFSDSKIGASSIQSPIANIKGDFVWEKDRYGKYIYANELYARAAGYDSPKSMLGKTDFDMPWRLLAEKFLEGDRKIMTGNQFARLNGVFEKEIMVDKVADIFVREGVMKDGSGRIMGVTGCFIDVTAGLGELLENKLKTDESGFYLGQEFGSQHLDKIEIEVLRTIVKPLSKEKIAKDLNKSLNEIKSIMQSLKIKFQCTREDDILITAIRSGLPFKLYD